MTEMFDRSRSVRSSSVNFILILVFFVKGSVFDTHNSLYVQKDILTKNWNILLGPDAARDKE